MKFDSLPKEVRWAVEAAQDKQALDISVLDLSGTGAFADYFLVCSGSSAPQLQAITRVSKRSSINPAAAYSIAKVEAAPIGCCSITDSSLSMFSAKVRASITISSVSGGPLSASKFPTFPATQFRLTIAPRNPKAMPRSVKSLASILPTHSPFYLQPELRFA